jgi:hypothetical protein
MTKTIQTYIIAIGYIYIYTGDKNILQINFIFYVCINKMKVSVKV